jgi:RNA polymerase primary sigma factor
MGKYINHNEDKTIGSYFKDLRQQPVLTKEEEFQLALRIKQGDQKAVEELTSANLKFVVSIAKEYQNNGLLLSDLISEGNYGLIKAAHKFDASRGFKFISYAVWWVRQAIIQALNEHSRTVRLPANVIGKITTTKKYLELFEQANEREPVFGELIAEDGTKLDMDIEMGYCSSLNDKSWDGEGGEYGDLLSDGDGDAYESKYDMDNRVKNKLEETLNLLTQRERDIIKCYYGIDTQCEPMTLEAIGDKYSLTKERVRQIKEKGIRKLRHHASGLFEVINT